MDNNLPRRQYYSKKYTMTSGINVRKVVGLVLINLIDHYRLISDLIFWIEIKVLIVFSKLSTIHDVKKNISIYMIPT